MCIRDSYSVNESDLEVRWDDGDTSNRLHPFDVPTLVNKDDDDQDIQAQQEEEERRRQAEQQQQARGSTGGQE